MKGDKAFTLIELMIVVSIIGILAALAIPNFLNFRSKAVQAEARANLGAIHTCQTIYFSEYDTYVGGTEAFEIMKYAPISGNNRYTYIIDQSILFGSVSVDPMPDGLPALQGSFTVFAVTNLDSDPFIDFWAINADREIRNQRVENGVWVGDGSDIRRQ